MDIWVKINQFVTAVSDTYTETFDAKGNVNQLSENYTFYDKDGNIVRTSNVGPVNVGMSLDYTNPYNGQTYFVSKGTIDPAGDADGTGGFSSYYGFSDVASSPNSLTKFDKGIPTLRSATIEYYVLKGEIVGSLVSDAKPADGPTASFTTTDSHYSDSGTDATGQSISGTPDTPAQTYHYASYTWFDAGSVPAGVEAGTASAGSGGTADTMGSPDVVVDGGPTPVVSEAGQGPGTSPDPDNIAGIAVPAGSDLFADNGQVFEVTDGMPIGFVEVVDASDRLPPGFVTLSGDTPNQVVVNAVAVDPVTSAYVQVDYDLSGANSVPITSVADVPSDTGRPVRDDYAQWWNDGGGVDFVNGDASSLIDLVSKYNANLSSAYDEFSRLADGGLPQFAIDNQTDDAVRNQTSDFEESIRKPLGDINKDGISENLSIRGFRNHLKQVGQVLTNYLDELIGDVQSGADQITTDPSAGDTGLSAMLHDPSIADGGAPIRLDPDGVSGATHLSMVHLLGQQPGAWG